MILLNLLANSLIRLDLSRLLGHSCDARKEQDFDANLALERTIKCKGRLSLISTLSVTFQVKVRTFFTNTLMEQVIMLDFAAIQAAAIPALMQVLHEAVFMLVVPSYTTFGKF